MLPSPQQIEELVRETFPECPDLAVAIMKAESLGEYWREGDLHLAFERDGQIYGKSIGLFQIRTGGIDNGIFWKRTDNVTEFENEMKIPFNNIKLAREIYDKGGWRPWSTYLNGDYKKFL